MANGEQGTPKTVSARLQKSTTVFLVGNIEATMEWYKQLGFASEYYPPGFAILRRDQIEIFLQQQPGYTAPDDMGRRKRQAWNVYIMTDDVRALYEEYSALPGVKISRSLCPQEYGMNGVRCDGFEWTPTGIRRADTEQVIGLSPTAHSLLEITIGEIRGSYRRGRIGIPR